MKLVHAADLHLDSPLRGLERYEGAPTEAVRGASRRAFRRLVDLCLDERAALLLLAGDLFDGDWRDYSTGLFFLAELARLAEAGTRVVLVRGNHDAQSNVERALAFPAHVRELSAERAESWELDDLGVVVHGRSFPQRVVREDLVRRYPDAVPGAFNVGLLHTALDGREGHDAYAPTSVAALAAKGYDYWALGHVHAREVVATAPWIVFPGNLQGRHVRETGPKGASLVHVESGAVVRVEHRVLDVCRFAVVDVPCGDATSTADVLDRATAAVRTRLDEEATPLLCARVRLHVPRALAARVTGDHDLLVAELRAFGAGPLDGALYLEGVRAVEARAASAGGPAAPADVGPLVALLADAAGAVGVAGARAAIDDLFRRLPADARPDDLALDDDASLGALLEEATALLEARLGGAR